MDKSIYLYILRHSKRQQIVLTIMAAASFPFLYAFYELPKMIINKAIQATNVDFPIELGPMEFGQVEYLFLLCGIFLLLVLFNQSFKYAINVYRGKVGEHPGVVLLVAVVVEHRLTVHLRHLPGGDDLGRCQCAGEHGDAITLAERDRLEVWGPVDPYLLVLGYVP